jgi:hypothetical protein
MKFATELLRYLLYTNVFISAGAAIAMWGTAYALHINIEFSNYIILALATLCAYNFHWWLTPAGVYDREREAWMVKKKPLLLALCLASLVAGCIYGVMKIQTVDMAYWLPLVLFTFMYTAPKIPLQPFVRIRKMVLAKTLYLSIGWWYATSYLPILLAPTDVTLNYAPFLWYRFFLIFLICFIFDYRDKTVDALSGIKSLLKFVTVPFAGIVCQVLLALCCVALTNVFGTVSTAHFCLLIIPVAALLLLHQYSLSHVKDLWYYGVLDSMLFASALAQLFLLVFGL